jgi:hypothetical protein
VLVDTDRELVAGGADRRLVGEETGVENIEVVVVASRVGGRADRPEDESDCVIAVADAIVVAVPACRRPDPAVVLRVIEPARVADAVDRDG